MAEIISGTVNSILFRLGSQAFQELGSNFKVSKELEVEMEKLHATLRTIKANILDAGHAGESNHSAKDAISRLEDALYDADDLLDEFQYEQLRQKVHRERRSQVRIHLSSLNPLSPRSKMDHRVKEIRERLDKVAAEFVKFGLAEAVTIDMGVPDQNIVDMGVVNSWRETDSFVKSEIIGRYKSKCDIINLLLEPTSNQGNVSIVALTGIGGLGKTALAQLVYNEATIQNHFSSKFWVCVSEEFDNKLLIKKILKSASGKEETVDILDREQLQSQLREVLGGKRYLIVLDDVWNDDSLSWDKFSKYLVDGAPGSKILVTTRNRSVASAMGINSPYVLELEGLDRDQSWDLFKQVAFRGQNKIDTKLELIGKEVVKRCKGVPLAIKTLASLMRRNPTEDFWSSIKEDHETWRKSLETEDGILPVLKLSYKHLPNHLRPCFAFCSIFPKNFIIKKDRLIQLWNAQGYIQPSNRNQRSVDLGDQYYNDLLSRSFFQEEMEDWQGNITCKMHDLIHDLAQLVAGSSFYTVKDDKQEIPKKVRHLLLECKPSQNLKIKGIRNILYPYNFIKKDASQILSFSSLNCFRTLDLSYMNNKILPKSMGKLKHLRFLDLSGNKYIKVLPDFITNLHNLQTLLLDNCGNLKKLPKDISKLISLECLSIEHCYKLKYLPKGLGKLTSLQRFNKFIVNVDEKIFSNSATLNELRDLNYLGGHLDILNLDTVRNVELESNEANLNEKKHLESLKLEWRNREDRNNKKELLLDKLEPHPNLKKLVIERYQGTRFSSWLSSITNLVSLEIRNNCCCQQLPRLDNLPYLESLSLASFKALVYVADDGIGEEEDPSSSSVSCSTSTTTTVFPSLKKLKLFGCNKLEGWWRKKSKNEGSSSDLPCFPCLSSLEIHGSPNLNFMPLFPSLDHLELWNASLMPLQQTLTMMTNKTSAASSSASSSSSSSSSRSSSTAPPLFNLKKLILTEIDNLETLPKEFLLNLTSLEYLKFDSFNKLESLLPQRTHCLTSLQKLVFCGFPNLKALPEWIPTLTSLKSLQIRDCPRLPFLPRGIHCLPSLEELVLCKCINLRALPEWLPTLTSLKTLEIDNCPQVLSLPGEMHRLTSLRELVIYKCPKLSETCKEESGKKDGFEARKNIENNQQHQISHWPQIAQIPNICIEDTWVCGKKEY